MQITDYLNDSNVAIVPEVLSAVGEHELAELFRERTRQADDLIDALGDELPAVATAIERAAVTPDLDSRWQVDMNFATAIRVAAGGKARQGQPLDWHEVPVDCWVATDGDGTEWFVSPETWGWGVTVSSWDRPDWYAESCEQAKVLAEEISARPKYPQETWIEEVIDLE